MKTYTLYIKAYSPATIPMARLVEYMRHLAAILGNESAVHFKELRPGSTKIVTAIDHEAVPKVSLQVAQVATQDAGPVVTNAFRAIDELMADDNASGFLYEDEDENAKVIQFPGVTKPRPKVFGPFNQDGSLDGVLISVGGADETAHLQLQNGKIKYTGIDTDRETARALAKHMYEPVRIFGTGRWLRDREGNWLLKRFRLEHFTVLQDTDLTSAFEKLRAVEGSGWKDLDDPISLIQELRGRDDGVH